MRLGIVGHEAAKFTPDTKSRALAEMTLAAQEYKAELIVSGGCHLGGVDIWAEWVADALNLPKLIHAPTRRTWSGPGGFMERNLAIARDSDLVLVVVVLELPPHYTGMRFTGCYHCLDRTPPHVKSGACWTAWRCKAREWRIIAAPEVA